jgi:hypothetical protein
MRYLWINVFNLDIDYKTVYLELYTNEFEGTNNGVFWDVTPCGSCNNRRFGGT